MSQTWTWINSGTGGATVASFAATIDARLDAVTQPSTDTTTIKVLVNLGVNDANLVEATWKADYQTIIDGIVTQWPSAKVYLMRPWHRGADATAALQHTWIDALVAANPGVVFVGPDEAVWLKGADDGATMTTDGTHYSSAGHIECANQWKAIIQP